MMLSIVEAQDSRSSGQPVEVLIRCDDVGMSHSVNQAMTEVIAAGIPVSVSVMFVCPWYREAVTILKQNPEVSVGIHLTLNAEWKNYRWGPITGASRVSSLVDDEGHFFPSRALLMANQPRVKHVRRELRAQIERALGTGLRIDYVDYHMGAAVSTPEFRAVVEELAAEYGLGISRYFGELDARSIYAVPYEQKVDSLAAFVEKLDSGVVNLQVFHIGSDTPELAAMEDLNAHGLVEMSKHRQAELGALISPAYREALAARGIRLITYRDLIVKMGLDRMHRPAETGN
jgi:predicted glycoside hydrolase/deacetylase ChbG (UPF0249 family)